VTSDVHGYLNLDINFETAIFQLW